MLLVPADQLSEDALLGLLEEYASRDGTDYGEKEVDLAVKVQQLRTQLTRGDIVIVFDDFTQSVNILPLDSYNSTLNALKQAEE